jgi:hypothetical protein
MESLQELKNVKNKTTAVADVGEQTAATNAIADAARTTSAAEVAATAAVSDEAEKKARNSTKYSETNIVVRSRAVNISDKDAGIDGESGDKAAAETAGIAGDMWQDEHTIRVLQEETKLCFKETQSSNLRNFP